MSVMIDLEALTQYVKKAKTGDTAAFAALFEATKELSYAIAYALLEDLCEAQDVVQETYLKVYLQLDTLRDDRSFLRWLHTITYNLTQDHIRSHTQERLALAEVAEQKRNTQLTLDEWMMDTWKQEIIRDMIMALPPEQQEAIRLYYFQNRSVGEIAVLQDCPINTVKSRLFYARNTLQKLIEAEEERTGRMHLSPVVTILAATLMLPDVGMTLPREDAMRILAAVFTAVGSADGIALVGISGEEAADPSRAAAAETRRPSFAVRLRMFFEKRWFLRLRGSSVLMLLCGAVLLCTMMLTLGYRLQQSAAAHPSAQTYYQDHVLSDGAGTAAIGDVPAPDTVDVKIPAPTVLAQGSCGADVQYTITDDGAMTFSGTGQIGADAPFNMTDINNGMDASVFAQDEALMALRDSITEIVIEEGITSTANCAFMRMQGLRKITFPQSCTVLGNAVLYGCPALTDVTLSDDTVILPEFCFKACTALETIVIPEKTEVINTEAFCSCRALHTVRFAGDVLRDIWVGAFCDTSSLTQIDLPDSLHVIEGNAFQYSGLRSIDLTGTDARIAGKAFSWCDQLETILLPDSMTELETDALSYLSALKTVKLGKSLRTIKNSAFRQSSLGELVLPASLIEISGKAFTDMSSLQQITVEADNPYFRSVDGVLYNRDMTRIIAYPSGRSDTSFYVPETVTEIGAYAFYTPRLEVILFAGEIRHMAKYAIYLPKSLQQVIFSGDVPALWERSAIYLAQSKAQWCVIYYPGDADGWTEGKWTAPDGTEYLSAVRD